MTESIELASIEQGDLREVWPSEATNFTPWLAENIEMLGEALGIDLEVQSTEVAIGPFSLDILAREPGADRAVAIENQLEETDHEHLGKLITYAGGSDARIVIWIAADFRDKHRQALDWLNQRSDDETEFFGVTVEIWKIDDSRPAPHFRIVAAPNHWSKPASCITSHRNLHTPCIPRHRLVLRIQSHSQCAQRRERRPCGVWVIVTRCEEDTHLPIAPESPVFMGRASPFARDLCNVRANPKDKQRTVHVPSVPCPRKRYGIKNSSNVYYENCGDMDSRTERTLVRDIIKISLRDTREWCMPLRSITRNGHRLSCICKEIGSGTRNCLTISILGNRT